MALVLVVDDEPDIRELVRLNLTLDGHEVITANDGLHGLEVLAQSAPDLVVLDVMMPGLDGWEVLARIKSGAVDGCSEIPVIMLTALASEMDKVKGGIEGAVQYLTKPFDIDQLRTEVRRAIEDDDEPGRRRQVQAASLERLAQLESGRPSPGARPRLSRFENVREPTPNAAPARVAPVDLSGLTDKQRELVTMVASSLSVRDAAENLGVSRSNVYASLRRVARKLDVPSVEELLERVRVGDQPESAPG